MIYLVPAEGKKALKAVLGVINKYSGLISPKTFTQTKGCHYFFVVMQEGSRKIPVGIIGYRPLNHWSAEQINTVILPQYRGRGYGRRASDMMSNLVLGELGFGKVFCTINTENKVMIGIKKSQGFSLEGRLDHHFGPGRHIYVMSKIRNRLKEQEKKCQGT